MTKITFEDLPSTNTPLDATNMNLLQTNVENAINSLISRIETLEAHDDLLPGTEIQQNADLNNFSTPGNYYASSSTTTNTLSNCPFTGSGLKLVVMQTTATRIRQEAYATNNSSANTYWRTYTTSGWQPWRQVTTTTV